jgi:hypothetical protein
MYGVEEVLILHVVTRNLTVQRFVRTFTHVNNEIEVHQGGAGHSMQIQLSMQNPTLRELEGLEGKRQVHNFLNVNYVTRD